MSTVDEVKNHLCKLLPKYIVRTNTDMKFNASYDDKSKIMIINEKKLFNSDSDVLTALFENTLFNLLWINFLYRIKNFYNKYLKLFYNNVKE